GLQQFNRARGKFARLLPPDHERADDAFCADQRHDEARPKSGPHRDLSDRAWRLVANICDLQWLSVLDRLAERIASTGWLASDCRNQLIAQAIRCPHLQCLVQLIKDIDHPSIRIRKLDCLGDDRGQHGLEIKRGVYCLRHLAKRAQFLYRLGKLAGARLHLLEQPHVLDRDHRLIGEGNSKLDLLVGEGLDSSALENDHADRRSFPYQRNAENGADTAETCPLQESEFGIGLDIRDMNDAAIDKDPPGRVAAVNCERTILHECYHFG